MALDRILSINLVTLNIHSEIKKHPHHASEYNTYKIVLVVLLKANEYNE